MWDKPIVDVKGGLVVEGCEDNGGNTQAYSLLYGAASTATLMITDVIVLL